MSDVSAAHASRTESTVLDLCQVIAGSAPRVIATNSAQAVPGAVNWISYTNAPRAMLAGRSSGRWIGLFELGSEFVFGRSQRLIGDGDHAVDLVGGDDE